MHGICSQSSEIMRLMLESGLTQRGTGLSRVSGLFLEASKQKQQSLSVALPSCVDAGNNIEACGYDSGDVRMKCQM